MKAQRGFVTFSKENSTAVCVLTPAVLILQPVLLGHKSFNETCPVHQLSGATTYLSVLLFLTFHLNLPFLVTP